MRIRARRLAGTLAAGLALAAFAAPSADVDSQRTGGPYVPTPQVVVDEMLRMAKVRPEDFVVDLGSGDGVIVLTAARKFQARGLGVDIDPELVKLSNVEARRLGVADRVRFQVQDVFQADLSKATVVTLYLLPSMMTSLRPKLFNELKPGTRIVSHDYHFGAEWPPDEQYTFDVPEKVKVNGVPSATVYLWIVPAKVAGRWRLRVEASAPLGFEVTLRQNHQHFEGTAEGQGAKAARFTHTRLRGEEISFAFTATGGRYLFRGRVRGDAMQGSVELPGGRGSARWTAVRYGG